MSDVETKRVFEGEYVSAETMPDGVPLGRPIRFKWGTTGHYMTVEQARQIVTEFEAAMKAVAEPARDPSVEAEFERLEQAGDRIFGIQRSRR